MTDIITLDRLHSIMSKAGIEDREIMSGVSLSRVGYQKLAVAMKVSVKEVNSMINELITKLRDEHRHVSEEYQRKINESDDDRYAYEKDFLKNVTIRDSETGEETFLSGAEAAELLNAIEMGMGDEQELLAHYAAHSNTLEEDLEGSPDDSYEEEIEAKAGTYNFPWKVDGANGTATVVYTDAGKMRLVSVRDHTGEEIPMDEIDTNDLLRQAVDFIGDV